MLKGSDNTKSVAQKEEVILGQFIQAPRFFGSKIFKIPTKKHFMGANS